MSAFIDMHHHILYGLDDGPINKQQMEAMLKAAYRAGVQCIIATPHISPGDRPFSMGNLHERIQDANNTCSRLGMDMQIYPGGEVLYTHQTERYLSQKRVPTLADSNKILVETSPNARCEEIEQACLTILRCGYMPVLAHIERYRALMHNPSGIYKMKERYDVQYQVNCEALLGRLRWTTKRTLSRLLKDRVIDYVASDAHNIDRRACLMQEAYNTLKDLCGERYADSLTSNHYTIEDFRLR